MVNFVARHVLVQPDLGIVVIVVVEERKINVSGDLYCDLELVEWIPLWRVNRYITLKGVVVESELHGIRAR